MSDDQWTVVSAAEAINDLLLITEFLTQSYCDFGEPLAEAKRHIVRSIGFGHAAEAQPKREHPPGKAARRHGAISSCCNVRRATC